MPDRTIWKYPILTTDEQQVIAPKGARPLTVQMQGGKPCLWALVDPTAAPEPMRLRTFGTGHPVGEESAPAYYVGTYQLDGGALVFHVFADRPTVDAGAFHA